jgi:hypothetical protein
MLNSALPIADACSVALASYRRQAPIWTTAGRLVKASLFCQRSDLRGHGVCGATCWRTPSHAVCIVSNG